jgi:hypothetical protein
MHDEMRTGVIGVIWAFWVQVVNAWGRTGAELGGSNWGPMISFCMSRNLTAGRRFSLGSPFCLTDCTDHISTCTLQNCIVESKGQKGVLAIPLGGAWKSMRQVCKELAKVVKLRVLKVHRVDSRLSRCRVPFFFFNYDVVWHLIIPFILVHKLVHDCRATSTSAWLSYARSYRS